MGSSDSRPAAPDAASIWLPEMCDESALPASSSKSKKPSESGTAHGSESQLLRKRLAAKERELEAKERELRAMRDFSKIRSEMKTNILEVQREMKVRYPKANTLDLVTVMDCTGSMSPWIQTAKASITTIIDNVKGEHANATVSVGFVGYRDFCDGALRLQVQPLTTDIAGVRDFIATLGAFGGGDGPEDIPGALEQVLAMSMQAEARCVVLVADSPCHGSEFHNDSDDATYAAQIRASPCIRQQMRTLARNGVDFAFIEVVPASTAKMVPILEAEYRSVLPEDGLERDFVKVALADSGDVVRFTSVVHTSASNSLTASKSRSVIASSKNALGVSSYHHYGPTGRKTTAMSGIAEEGEASDIACATVKAASKAPLDWTQLDHLPEIDAMRHSVHFRSGDRVNWAKLDLKHSTQQTKIKILPTCFAKGAMRGAHGMFDCKMGKRFVAKCYFGKAAKSKLSLESDVEMQIVAKRLATSFSLSPQVPDTVDFIFTCWYELKDPAAAGLSSTLTAFTAEPFIEGEYKKYNNNNGWINEANLAMGEVAQAFSHFTWQETYGHLMVVDIQGVGGIFTDPQIHSLQEEKFGRGNLSKVGMAAFFCTHTCNDICAALKLTSFKDGKADSEQPMADEAGTVVPAADKTMTCSCPLCGMLMGILHSRFIKAHEKEREVFCEDCTAKVKERISCTCASCKGSMVFSHYWYDMKGMEYPTTCKNCKVTAAETKAARSSTK